MRRVAAALVLAALLAGCGDDAAPRAAAVRTAEHLPPQAQVVVAARLDRPGVDALVRAGLGRVLLGTEAPEDPRAALAAFGSHFGLGGADIDAVLGGKLRAGLRVAPRELVVTYTPRNAAGLQRLLAGLGDPQEPGGGVALVGERTLVWVVVADREPATVLRERLERPLGPPLPALGGHLAAARVSPDLVDAVAPALRGLKEGLRGATLDVDVTRTGLRADGVVDYEGVGDERLPLGPPQPLELPQGEPIRFGLADAGHLGAAAQAGGATDPLFGLLERGVVGTIRPDGAAGVRLSSRDPGALRGRLRGTGAVGGRGETVTLATTQPLANALATAPTAPAPPAAFRLEGVLPGGRRVLLAASARGGDIAVTATLAQP